MDEFEEFEVENDKIKQVKEIINTLKIILNSLKTLAELTGRERIIEEHSINSYNQLQLFKKCIFTATGILDNIIKNGQINEHKQEAVQLKTELTLISEEFKTLIAQNGLTIETENTTPDLFRNIILNTSEEA